MKTKKKFINGFIILFLGIFSFSCKGDNVTTPIEETPLEETPSSKIETFTLTRNFLAKKGKIYLPASYESNKNLPTIYLIDFTEQHFKLATDEFAKVIDGVEQIEEFDALVVTLENIPDVDAIPGRFHEYYDVFKNLTSYIDSNYTNNTSRTFIARGSEAGIVLQTLFLENLETSLFENFIATDPPISYNSVVMTIIQLDAFPKNKSNKKLHFSFSQNGESQNSSNTNLIDKINSTQFPWLQFESVECVDNDYENTYPIAFAEGLKYVFSK